MTFQVLWVILCRLPEWRDVVERKDTRKERSMTEKGDNSAETAENTDNPTLHPTPPPPNPPPLL